MTAEARAARRPIRRRVLAVVAWSAATIGLFELVLAVCGLPRTSDSPEQSADTRDFADPRAYVVDPTLLWRLRPRAMIDAPDLAIVGVRTNSRGLRGADRDDELRASRLRVLCLGDSVTFGLALSEADAFPSRLEDALRARFPADVAPVVVNGGVPGYSSVQGMRLLAEFAPTAPDVVVWWFGMNDAKPALGGPDAKLHPPEHVGGGVMPFLRKLRSVRFAESIGARLRGDATRVSADEERATVAALEARAAAGGPAVVFVRCPSRLDEKLAQLESIVAAVGRAGATRVDGATDALSVFTPGPPGCEAVSRVEDRGGIRTALLGPGRLARKELALDEVGRRRDYVAKWTQGVDACCREMPPDALGYADLFGTAQPAEVFADNCHMTAAAARSAADALARRIADVVARRGGPARR